MSFSTLGLLPELVRALDDRGYVEPTPVQRRVIPVILQGRDILAGAQTGTGKTAGFTLPLLQRLSASPSSRAPRALILVPTRELAAQVADSVKSYGKYLQLRTVVIFGGVGMHPQIDALRRGTDVLVATPGRLLDHAQQGTVDLSRVGIFVLDEADRMLDMGFIHDIKRVLKLLPKQRQNLLFSATYSDDIRRLAQGLLHDPAEIEVARRNTAVESVEQQVYMVGREQKRGLLSQLIHDGNWNQVLVFTRTKHGANRLTKQLIEDGIEAAAIHGNKSQSARTQALANFKGYRIRALVATEVAARGLDIKELPHVVNFDLPNVAEDYVHRIGRTGRAGASGAAVSLVSPDEVSLLRGIEKLIARRIPVLPTPEIVVRPVTRRIEVPTPAPQQPSRRNPNPNHGFRGGNSRPQQRSSNSGGGSAGRSGYRSAHNPRGGQRRERRP